MTKAPITKLVTQLIDLDYLARISPMKVAPVKAPKVPKVQKQNCSSSCFRDISFLCYTGNISGWFLFLEDELVFVIEV